MVLDPKQDLDTPEWYAAWAALPATSKDASFQLMNPQDLVRTKLEPEPTSRLWGVEELEEL